MEIVIVRPGDTLWGIAARRGVAVERLVSLNQLDDPARLVPGLALLVPGGGAEQRREIVVNAYAYPHLAPGVAREEFSHFSFFCPFSSPMTEEGTLETAEDGELRTVAREAEVLPFLTVTNLGENGTFSSELAHRLFTDPAAQERLFDAILRTAEERRYGGVNFNLEYLYPFDREGYRQFLLRASALLHREGLYLTTAIAPKVSDEQQGLLYTAHDYAAHGEAADWVVLMTYEWGYTYSEPRAVSPVNEIRRVLDYAVTAMPRGKILLGFSNYAYRWALPWRQGVPATVLSDTAAANLACAVGAEVHFDRAAQAPTFSYTDPAGVRQQVWFEDARSHRARFALVEEYGLGGVSYWTVNHLNRAMLALQNEKFIAEKFPT